ncbi:MAG TPA: hypothetical protein VGL86_05140 [Polyangia bacterium]|jgi:hypothetical protein
MNTDSKFTILSTRAPLIEVDGDGPYYMLPAGVAIADGARTTVRLDLAATSIRKFRVDAPPTVSTAVMVGDSPFGAFAHIRRCVQPKRPNKWRRLLAAPSWPRVTRFLQRHGRTALALWFLFTDDVEACRWQNLENAGTDQVLARGGDIVVVSFINAESDHA